MIHEVVVVVTPASLSFVTCSVGVKQTHMNVCVCMYTHGQLNRCEVLLVNENRMMKICSKEESSVEQSRFFAFTLLSPLLPLFICLSQMPG